MDNEKVLALSKELNDRVQSFNPVQGITQEAIHWVQDRMAELNETLGGEPAKNDISSVQRKMIAPGIYEKTEASAAEVMLSAGGELNTPL